MKNKMKTSRNSVLIRTLSILFLALFSNISTWAQSCLVNSLDVSTGVFNGATLTPGNPDPLWIISNKTTVFTGGGVPSIGTNAFVVNRFSSWESSWTWICDDQSHATPTAPQTPKPNTSDYMTFKRNFKTCEDGEVIFNLSVLVDNNIREIYVDGVPQGISNPIAIPGNYTLPAWNIPSFVVFLAGGTHSFEIEVGEDNTSLSTNPIGLSVQGTINTSTNNIINDQDPSCDVYVCSSCDETCFWRLQGNNILNGNNIFGTLSNDDIDIRSNSLQRGIITSTGLLGWNLNAANPPAAFLDVNCIGNNPDMGTSSDIRFRDLETPAPGHNLSVLGIDGNGYVYNTGQSLSGGNGWDVNGNTTPANSIFGITSATGQDITIHTNGVQRGVMTAGTTPMDDGRLGWRTPAPTAALHVDCIMGNPDDGSMGSDIRFENLEPGVGEILVIDPSGYVYRSSVNINDVAPDDGATARMQKRITDLEQQVSQLTEMLNNNPHVNNNPSLNHNELYQNRPNPFNAQTNIGYNIVEMEYSAMIAIFDLNGREITRYMITKKGKGEITVNNENLIPGQYLYSLIVDGQEQVTKKMVVL